ncbi:hypothetical protein [Halorubrum vacuolatum]|uniref:Uncharacterized protein n=1 Tax=Halorubrum vacuolatum TaxID=63740 RepID=A0A238Y0M4_HALVU|nr:hypothetical protein [Halorubrum vacuolatum]SNR64530.1 hypothetical protein SAMN06264855_1271 [Halorubrum vacuolatum]
MRRCSYDGQHQHTRRRLLKTTAAGSAGILLFGAGAGPISASDRDESGSDTAIHHEIIVDWHSEERDRISLEVTLEFSGTDTVALRNREQVTIESSNGFEETQGGYQTDTSGETLVASVPTQPAEFIQTIYGGDDWAFIAPERVVNVFSHRPATLDYSLDISIADGTEGIAHGHHVLLGSYETYSKEASEEEISLIVPDAADLSSPAEDILDALVNASDRVDIGGESERVYKFAVPEGITVGGSSDGSNTSAWTRTDFEIDSAQSVWDHEYIHTRQEYQGIKNRILPDETEWIFEGKADHYGILLPYEDGRVSFSELRRAYERGLERHEDAVLKQKETWEEERRANYEVGALVLGRLDLEIRRATDGERSIDDLFRQFNEYNSDAELTHDQLLELIEETSTTEVADLADQYMSTTQRPEMWDQDTHEQYFESPTREEAQEESDDEDAEAAPSESNDDAGDDDGVDPSDSEDEEASPPEEETVDDTSDDVPGMGVVAALAGLGSAVAYGLISADEPDGDDTE